MIEPEQLDLFFDPPPKLITLPPCGRNLGRCVAVVERDRIRCQIRCLACGGTAPIKSRARTFLDGYIKQQLEFLQSRSRRRGA